MLVVGWHLNQRVCQKMSHSEYLVVQSSLLWKIFKNYFENVGCNMQFFFTWKSNSPKYFWLFCIVLWSHFFGVAWKVRNGQKWTYVSRRWLTCTIPSDSPESRLLFYYFVFAKPFAGQKRLQSCTFEMMIRNTYLLYRHKNCVHCCSPQSACSDILICFTVAFTMFVYKTMNVPEWNEKRLIYRIKICDNETDELNWLLAVFQS